MNFTCDDMKQIRMDITCSLLHAMDEVRKFETARLLVALWEAGDELRELWISTAPDARDDAAVYELPRAVFLRISNDITLRGRGGEERLSC